MNVPTLSVILNEVLRRTEERMKASDLEKLEEQARKRKGRPFAEPLRAPGMSIIAEIKRASPSAGMIRMDLVPADLAQSYESGGARALSVLTCAPFFHGRSKDLKQARKAVKIPALCKDFLLTGFQVLEAAAHDADAILLIAAALDDASLKDLSSYAGELGLEILYEIHSEKELDRVLPLQPTLLGVNSRNLNTMEVEPGSALELGSKLPDGVVTVYESGIQSSEDLRRARDAGYQAALIGESLLNSPDPSFVLYELLDDLADDDEDFDDDLEDADLGLDGADEDQDDDDDNDDDN
jgi:indole-3-glycerol phosphate synthase